MRHSSALSWAVRRVVCWSQIQTNGEVVAVGAEYFGEEVEQKGRRGQAQALDVLYCMRNSPNVCGEGYPCRAQKTPADNPTGVESRTD